jgi:hypothetical protein
MITPTARSITFPRIANFLKSWRNDIHAQYTTSKKHRKGVFASGLNRTLAPDHAY